MRVKPNCVQIYGVLENRLLFKCMCTGKYPLQIKNTNKCIVGTTLQVTLYFYQTVYKLFTN